MNSFPRGLVRRASFHTGRLAFSGPGAGEDNPRAFRCAVADYLVYLNAAGRCSATIESYARTLTMLDGFLSAELPLEALSSDVLIAALSSMFRADGAGGVQRSEVTLNRYRSTYKAFCRWAFETGKLPSNPALRLHLARVDSAPTPPITPQEIRLFLSAIRSSHDPLGLRDEALFSTYALTGLRRTEALSLDVSDYDAAQRTLRVKDGKGRRVRTVPVIRVLGLLLDKLHDGLSPYGDPALRKLFPGRIPGSGLTPRQAHARFQRWKAAAGLRPELTIHSFRAGFATTLYRGTGDLILVSRALGHRDIRLTLRYVEPCPKKLLRAIEKSFAGVA